MGKQIFAAEISHENTPIDIREKFYSDDASVKKYLQTLGGHLDEVFIVATCNRFAVYAYAETIDPLVSFFHTHAIVQGYAHFYYTSEESITHLFATSSGLLSQIKGEHQILTQLSHAFELANECDTMGSVLNNLLREAIHVGRTVRTLTGIDKYCTSVVDAGFSLLYERLNDIHDKRFLVVGTGKVVRLALSYLKQEGVSRVSITGQDTSKALQLAGRYGYHAVALEDIVDHFTQADIIIGGTNHDVSIAGKALTAMCVRYMLSSNMHKRRMILDFGMPRNFEDGLRQHPSVELYNLDDLKILHKTPLDAFGGLQEAWRIVITESKKFLGVLSQLEISPILAAYWTRLVDIKNHELDRLLPKLENATERDIELIRKYAHKIIRRISREPLKNIRAMANNLQAENPMEVVKNLYDFHHLKLNTSKN